MNVKFIFECIIWENKVFDVINERYNHEDGKYTIFDVAHYQHYVASKLM